MCFLSFLIILKVKHTGTVESEISFIAQTLCKMDLAFFPYDEQNCSITFWTNKKSEQIRLNMTYNTSFDSEIKNKLESHGLLNAWKVTNKARNKKNV